MNPGKPMRWIFFAILVSGIMLMACSKSGNAGQSASAASDGGKIPITTKSEEAKKEFLQGRDLAEKLRAQESVAHFDKAIALDPDFASAEMARANSAPTAKDFFEHLNKAVALSGKASEGERLFILANEAGANGEVVKQKEYLDNSSPFTLMTSARVSISAITTLVNKSMSRRLRTTKKLPNSLPTTRPPTTFLVTPTVSRGTIRTRSRPSRSTSS